LKLDVPLSEQAIVEFTTRSGLHFRLALCEHTVFSEKIPCVLYVTDDKKTFTREILGGRFVRRDLAQIGVALPDTFSFMKAEGMKFIKWLQQETN